MAREEFSKMVTLLLPGVPLAFYSLPVILSLFLAWTSLSYLERNQNLYWMVYFSDQFSRSVMSDSLRPHALQHARLPCPSPAPCFLFYLGHGQIGNIQRRLPIRGWVVGTPSSSLGREGQDIEMGTEVCYQTRHLPVGAGPCPEGGKPDSVSKYRSWCEHYSQCIHVYKDWFNFQQHKNIQRAVWKQY